MAQAGYTPISLYYSTTAAAVPTAGNLNSGELAINITDGKLYYKSNAGVVLLLASNATSAPVLSFQTSLGGLTPSTATTGVVTLAGTLNTSSGGTGLSSYTAGDLSYYASGTALTKLAIGTAGQILTSSGTAPQWSTLSGVAVTTFSAGTTGFTPSSATSGAVTLAGTLATTNGGTGLTSFTSGGVVYASSTSALATGGILTYDGNATFRLSASGAGYFRGPTDMLIGEDASSLYIGEGFGVNPAISFKYGSAGTTFQAWKAGGSEQMRLTGIGLGVGQNNPTVKLDVLGPNEVAKFAATNAASGYISFYYNTSTLSGFIGNGSSILTGASNSDFVIRSEGSIKLATSGNNLRATIDTAGDLVVGDTSSFGRITGSKVGKGSIAGIDLSTYAAGVGGTLDLGGNYRTVGDYQPFVRVAAEKANGTNTDFGYNMAFFTTTNGGATMANRVMTLDSVGKIAIGNNIPMWSGAYGGALFLKGDNATSNRFARLCIVDSTGASMVNGLTITSVGNASVGITGASDWLWPDSSTGAFQLQAGAAFTGYNAGAIMSQNYFYNSGEKFIDNGYAERYIQTTGLHIWQTSTASNSSGAGASLSWTDVGRFTAAGQFLVGSNTAAGSLGSGTIQVGSGHGGITNTGSIAPSVIMSGALEFNLDGVSGSQRHARILGTGDTTGGAYAGGMVLQYYAYDGSSTYQWYTGINIGSSGIITAPATYTNVSAGTPNMFVQTDGTFYRGTSALKYKQDIRDLELIDINKFRAVRYKSKCKNDDQTIDYFGVIADEVDDAGIKELVTYGTNGEVENFQYDRFTMVLLKEVQAQKAIIESLKARLDAANL